jgi:hypothetical protein
MKVKMDEGLKLSMIVHLSDDDSSLGTESMIGILLRPTINNCR